MKPKEQEAIHEKIENAGDANNNNVLFDVKSIPLSTPSSIPAPSRVKLLVKTTGGRLLLLILLTIDVSASTLLQRYTLVAEGSSFLASAAVFVAEAQKLLIAIVVGVFWEHAGCWKSYLSTIRTELEKNPTDTLLMAVPSIVYAIQNNLGFVALANLDPATYQVTVQFKIVLTTLLMTTMLDTHLSKKKWLSIFLLTIGVIAVNLDGVSNNMRKSGLENVTKDLAKDVVKTKDINYAVGLSAVFAYCSCSGFASVYFERLLKRPTSGGTTSLWIKNAQIYFFGSAVGALIMIGFDGKAVMANGVFHGFDFAVHVNVLLHSFGGVLISLVVKYTDNIVKNFANGAAILVSTAGAVFIFQTQIGPLFLLGAIIVCVSAYLYKS